MPPRPSPDPRRARVAIFVFDLSATGVARNAVALAQALAIDCDVDLIGCRGGMMAVDGVTLTVLRADAPIGWRQLPRLTADLRRHLRATRPAAAISAGNRGHLMFLLAISGLQGIRRIYRFSNDIEHRRGARRGSWLSRAAKHAQMALLLSAADRIVPVSRHLLDDPWLARAAARGQAVVIENGVDVDRVRARAEEAVAVSAAPYVLGIGRLAPQKNFATLVDAVALANLTRALNLVILGGGSDAARAALASQAAALGIAHRLSLPGVVDNPFAWLRHAAVFALPSWWEGASNVLLEALAVGTAVVASPTAGNAASVLGDGAHGLLADPGDAAAWAAALLRQIGPARVLPGDRADTYRLDDTLAAWRELVAAELAIPSSLSR